MPRANANASTLRNRNRVTNKTRLKVYRGSIDADPLLLEEDEVANVLKLNTQGVDAEDANEHHLQAVLSAATQRHQNNSQRLTRGATDKTNVPAPAVVIPVPDSTGVVKNYEELYPSGRWKSPASYIRSSDTVDESCANALANGFTYYMDERDQEWLDKNNEESRGEGTSAQGALSGAGIATRSVPTRSAKAKGKEPDVPPAIAISEDEFELVMGLFEMVTHEKTEFLHHSLETGMPFPAFTEYQDTFSSSLPPTTFAAYSVPSWIPPPTQLLRIARVIYPHWKERRIDRGGLRIIPTLNFDETDTANESYICFRRREIKAVRKTRASQVTFSDKLVRLQSELSQALDLAKTVLNRENLKQECVKQGYNVWDKRRDFVELKRKFPALGDKGDDDLLHDKERAPKHPKTESYRLPGLKLRTRDGDLVSPLHQEPIIRPKERRAMLSSQIERELQRQKLEDQTWEDQIDNGYQAMSVPYPSRLFKHIPSSDARSVSMEERRQPRAVRMRYGRGGRILLDRRNTLHRSSPGVGLPPKRTSYNHLVDSEEDRRLAERWRFDADDQPSNGPESDEQDRVLVDDYDSSFILNTMTLLQDPDQASLSTDPSIVIYSPDGRQQSVVPFKLGGPQIVMPRRDLPGRPFALPQQAQPNPQPPVSHPPVMSTPISIPTQVKKIPHASALPQLRISSNGGMRTPGLVTGLPTSTGVLQTSPSNNTVPAINGINGLHRSGITTATRENVTSESSSNVTIPNGVGQSQADIHHSTDANAAGQPVSPPRAKIQKPPPMSLPNGYHLTAINGYPAIPNGSQFLHASTAHNGLSVQQMQNLKSAFATVPPVADLTSVQTNNSRPIPTPYMGHVVTNGTNFNMPLVSGTNVNIKLPPARPMQWATTPMQRGSNGVDSSMTGSPSPSPNHVHALPGTPARTPSATGTRAGIRGPTVHSIGQGSLVSHSMSPHQHSSSPLPSSLSQVQNSLSPRLPQTPAISLVSPLFQQQQPVGNSQSGY